MTGADSAGRPWQGRSFAHHDEAYRDDDGRMPTAFEDAMRALEARGHDLRPVVESLREARLLVPLVAEAGATETVGARTVDKTQELSIVAVAGPDGAPILPMFSNVDAMRSWRVDARPVPASMQRAAAAALEDGTARIIVDPGSWSEVVLLRPMLEALLAGTPWEPATRQPIVMREIIAPLLELPGLAAVVASSGDPRSRLQGRELEVRVLFSSGADRTSAQAAFERAAQRIGAHRARWITTVRDVAFQVVWLTGRARISPAPGSEVYTPGAQA